MTSWRRTIRIKHLLDPDAPIADVRDAVVARLKTDRAWKHDDDYRCLVEEMAETDTVDYFDACLDALYDWADANLVWIGADDDGSVLVEQEA